MTAVSSGLPTPAQIRGWRTDHLRAAAGRWERVADTWTAAFSDIDATLPTPHATVWEGDASAAAQARSRRDRASVVTLAQRLRAATRLARSGAEAIDAAKSEALLVLGVADTLGFDVGDDLAVVDRVSSRPAPVDQLRRRQADLLALTVRAGAAQLAGADHRVAGHISKATAGFDALDFTRRPIGVPADDPPSFGQCFTENFTADLGENMVQGVVVGGVLGAARGGLVGILGGPFGVFGGAVLGFVGGAASGAIISGPARTAVTAAWDCR